MLIDIYDFREKYLGALEKLEKECFKQPWSVDNLKTEFLKDNSYCKIAVLQFCYKLSYIKLNRYCLSLELHYLKTYKKQKQVCGYTGMYSVLDEGYITNIGVYKNFRNSGVAQKLIENLFEDCKKNNIKFVTLEVRTSNDIAINFYKKFLFKEVGIRKNFYGKPIEDALLMTKFL